MATDAWLVRDDTVLAAVEVAADRSARRRGLRGRDAVEGALLLRPCHHVHTFGVKFPIDVAFCDGEGTVLSTATLPPRRLSRFSWRSRFVVEAAAGAFARWQLEPGDRLEVVEVPETSEQETP